MSSNPQTEPKKTNNVAIVGFVLAFLVPLIGFIISIIGLVIAKDYNGKGRGLSVAGIIVSIIMFILSFFSFGLLNLNFWLDSFYNHPQNHSTTDNKEELNTLRANELKKISKPDALSLTKLYVNKTDDYSLKLPGWWLSSFEDKGVASEIAHKGDSGDFSEDLASVRIEVEKFYPKTIAELISQAKNVRGKSAIIKAESDVTINTLNGHEIFISQPLLHYRDPSINYYVVILTKENLAYTLEYTTSPDLIDKYLPIFKASAQSFVIK